MGDTALYIGRGSDNDIILPGTYRTASSQHAKITLSGEDEFVLHDIGSKNGTFVNDRRITTVHIRPSDEVRFGSHVYSKESLWAAIKKKFLEGRTDFSKEYRDVLHDFQIFDTEKGKIYGQSRMPMIIRIGCIGSVIAILLLFPNLVPDSSLRYPIIIGAGILASFFASSFTKSQAQKSQAHDVLKNEYDAKLVCPKCSLPLLNKGGYHYWKEKKTCISPKCDAVYVS